MPIATRYPPPRQSGARKIPRGGFPFLASPKDKRLVLLPDTKSGRPRVVPLAEEAWKEVLMLSLKRESEWPSSPWVFTLDGERPISKSAIR